MRFTPYISLPPYLKFSSSNFYMNTYMNRMRQNAIYFIVLLLLTLLMSACTNTLNRNAPDDLKSMSKDISDLVALPHNESIEGNEQAQQIQISTGMSQPASNTKNAYLEQEARLMSGVPDDVIATYQQALVLMEQQKWLAANALFDQVIAKQANLSGSYVNQALILKALSKQQSTEQAKQEKASELLIDKAISVNPLNPYAQHFKGQILQAKGQFEQAEQHYATALSIWPHYSEAQLDMAVLLELYRGKLLDAYQYYTAYLQLKVDDKQVQRWQAALAIKIKRAGLTLPVQEGE